MMRGRVLADLDPLGVNGRHGRFEVTELLLLLAVKPALTTGLLWRFVVAAVLARYRWSLASVEHSLTAASSGLDYGSGLKEICHE